ncbi:MAG: hypothetical protein EBV83_03700, partial [Verrucomicrobia bacterium]|nr:hypothetical protein [Verrucomicrobiota bacterium]
MIRDPVGSSSGQGKTSRIGFMVSGKGRLALAALRHRKSLGFEPSFILWDTQADLLAQAEAEREGVPCFRLSSSQREEAQVEMHDILQKQKTNWVFLTFDRILDEKILALIGLSFIFRMELWQPNLPATRNDGHFHPVRMEPRKWQTKEDYYIGDVDKECNSVIDPDISEWYRQQLIWQDKESLVVETLIDIIMFLSFCQQQNIQCQIWNNADLWPDHPHVNCQDVFL